jgi:hypothetical protein
MLSRLMRGADLCLPLPSGGARLALILLAAITPLNSKDAARAN